MISLCDFLKKTKLSWWRTDHLLGVRGWSSCPLSQWYHLTISFSVIPFASCLQLSQHQGLFPVRWLFPSGDQNIGASASASVPPMNIQDWFPLGFIGLISLQSKGFSRVLSNSTGQRHKFFSAQSLQPYMATGKTIALSIWTFVRNVMSLFFICCLGLS